MYSGKSIIIVGAGIGGLTAALSLLKAGINVEVYEQASQLGEVGAGVQISANGNRVLFALGLEQKLKRVAWEPQGKIIRLWNTGETWTLFDLGSESIDRYGYPYFMYHRADLHEILVEAINELKTDTITLNAEAIGINQDENSAILHLRNGSTAIAHAIVGADGVHSNVRTLLHGKDDPEFKVMKEVYY